MILFDNWTISVIGLVARQYDNLSRRIDVEGDLPDGYTWQLLVQSGGNADTLLLQPTENGAGVVLTADNLSKSGEYYFQLRGVLEADGVTKRHTNVVSAHIPKSLTGVGNWPEVPTEFYQVEANILELYQHPPVPGSNGYWLVWDPDADKYVESQLPLPEATTGGTSDHSKLKNRDAADQHPMSAITGLRDALAGKQPTGNYLTEENDPTVPDWAKQPQKPAYTAQEVGALPDTTHIPSTAADVNAEPAGAVSQHNVSDAAHSDIRLLIQGLAERLSAVADSDDTTLDQLSEIVAYIKSNKSLIDAITSSKVNVADIVDNLTTNAANKPLSAAQGVALKALIDALTEAIPEPYTLPIASPTVLGGVQPVAKTDAMTQSVGVDEAGALWAPPGSGGGSQPFTTLGEDTLTEDVASIDLDGFSVDRIAFAVAPYGSAANSGNLNTKIFFGLSDGRTLSVRTGLLLVTSVAGKVWNKSVCFASITGEVFDYNCMRQGGVWNTDIFLGTNEGIADSGNNIRIYRSVVGTGVKITSLSIGLDGTGVIGANTQFKVVGA